MNSIFTDIAFLAAKIATLDDERAHANVGMVSLAYNAGRIAFLQKQICEYTQCLSVISLRNQYGLTDRDDLRLAQCCRNGISECQQELMKSQVMTVMDLVELLAGGIK